MTILITGGAGFIGSNIAAALDEAGEDIVIADWLGTGDLKWRNIAKRRLAGLIAPEAVPDYLRTAGGELRAIVHMGAISSTTETDVDRIVASNFQLSVDLWRFCAAAGLPFVYASSAATYGDGGQGFLDRTDDDYLRTLRPLNPYGWSKHLFDRWVMRAVESGAAAPPRWAGFKFFNVYGPNEYHKAGQRSVALQFFEQIEHTGVVRLFRSDRDDIADGEQRRDFVAVEDCVAAVRWALAAGSASGIYNVGAGAARSFNEQATILFALLRREPRIDYVDLPEALRGKYQYHTRASLEKLRAAGHPAPATSLEEGLRSYVTGYLAAADRFR